METVQKVMPGVAGKRYGRQKPKDLLDGLRRMAWITECKKHGQDEIRTRVIHISGEKPGKFTEQQKALESLLSKITSASYPIQAPVMKH